jgi:hypothetical protein
MNHSNDPATQPTGQDGTRTPQEHQAEAIDGLDQAMATIARGAGAVLHSYPRPGRAVRRVVLREDSDDLGTRHEDATLDEDGTLSITGHDQGGRVSDFWGSDITSYEWVHVVAADRVPALAKLLGGHEGDDVLALMYSYYQRLGGQIGDIMKHPDVAAHFANWHS